VTSIVTDPAIIEFAEYIRIEFYDRDGGHSDPRWRIEAVPNIPMPVIVRMLDSRSPCVACGKETAYFRQRNGGWSSVYIAVTCGPIHQRGAYARAAYRDLRAMIEGRPSAQGALL